jgi:hypothetical protein
MAEDWETKTRILFRKREEPGMAEEQEVSSEESRNHQKTEEAGSGGRHRTRELLQEEMGAAVRPREIDANITFAFSRLGSLTGERSIRLTSAPNSGTLVVPCQAPHLATDAIRYTALSRASRVHDQPVGVRPRPRPHCRLESWPQPMGCAW